MIHKICTIAFFSALTLLVYAQDVDVNRKTLGKVTDSRLQELSGMIQSRHTPSLFWVHNDSGDSARAFLIDEKATVRCEVSLAGVDAVDMEDIAWFEDQGKSYVVLADIGDNRAVRKAIELYIFEEPKWDGTQSNVVIAADKIEKVVLHYEDKPRDAEAIFIDPTDLKVYLISKRDFQVGLYPFSLKEARVKGVVELKRALSLPMTFITAADMSRDGKGILIKNLGQVFYWSRDARESVIDVLKQDPDTLQYQPEPQGEVICFGVKRNIFYTVSERPLGLDAYLYQYDIVSSAKDD